MTEKNNIYIEDVETKEISLRTARPNGLLSPFGHTLSAQSIFRDVHAAAKNELDLIRGLRAANSARLLGNLKNPLTVPVKGFFSCYRLFWLTDTCACHQ